MEGAPAGDGVSVQLLLTFFVAIVIRWGGAVNIV